MTFYGINSILAMPTTIDTQEEPGRENKRRHCAVLSFGMSKGLTGVWLMHTIVCIMNIMSPNQYSILATLGENPRREYHLHELGRLIGKKPGVFQRGINSLEKEGLVISRRQGKLRLFRINENHPLHKEIMALVRKTYGIEALLREAVMNIPGIRIALIYGSYAQNKMRADSDVDLLIVADDPKTEDILVEALDGIEKAVQREVNYKLYDAEDFERKRELGDPFLQEVLSGEHVALKGSS
jgi:predicted nucleotidyltransferase